LGRADKVVKLSGEPSPARYTSGEELENGQKLMWVIESHSPITKYTLKYKNRKVLNSFLLKKECTKIDGISER
jgi:hypothetical protein